MSDRGRGAAFAPECNSLDRERLAYRSVAGHRVGYRRAGERLAGPKGGADPLAVAGELCAFRQLSCRLSEVPTSGRHRAPYLAKEIDAPAGVEPGGRGNSLLAQALCPVKVPLEGSDDGRDRERVAVERMVARIWEPEGGPDREDKPRADLHHGSRLLRHEPQGQVRIAGVHGVLHCGEQVVVVRGHAAGHRHLLGPIGLVFQTARQLTEVLRVSGAERVGLTEVGKAVLAVLPNGLEQPVARLVPFALGDDQRLGDEAGQPLEYLAR